MTIPAGTRRNTYTGTGSVATYDYTFRITAAADLLVTVADADGSESTLAYPADYSVTGVGNADGGTITLTAGNLASGYAIAIRDDPVQEQETDLRNQASFFAEVHEDAFDYLTRLLMAQQDVISRSLVVGETESGVDTALPPLEAGLVLSVNADADGFIWGSVPEAPVSAFMATVLDDADASEARLTLGVQELLSANRTYYVSTTGDDGNDGSSGSPWATLQYAYNWIQENVNVGQVNELTIQLANGTYTQDMEVWGPVTGTGDENTVEIRGDPTTPSNVVINGTLSAHDGAVFAVRGVKLQNPTSLACIESHYYGSRILLDAVNFGAAAGLYHIHADLGGIVSCEGDYTISGSAARHYNAERCGIIWVDFGPTPVTLTGTPAFSIFAYAKDGGGISVRDTAFTGSATGSRYAALQNGWIDTDGNGISYLPGDAVGSVASGGSYDGLTAEPVYSEGDWTPSPVSLTVVGTPTYEGDYIRIGNLVHCTLRVASTTSTACTAGTTYFTGLPFTVAEKTVCSAANGAATASYGNGMVSDADGFVYPPTWAATAEVVISFTYECTP